MHLAADDLGGLCGEQPCALLRRRDGGPRSAGSFASAVVTISRNSRGTPSRSGSPDMTRNATASGAPPPNGRRPVAA
ncbi:hypothetical protein O1M54_03005 [Streptomyces diastatochromogenes]|nr:hypothetical protein [Streptomyces diastatochromogenes]